MRVRTSLFLTTIPFFLLLSLAQLPPSMPMIVSGNVTVSGEPAPVGTVITAKIGDRTVSNFTVVHEGVYVLTVQGTGEDIGKPIRFYVDGLQARETLVFEPGEVREGFDLKVDRTTSWVLIVLFLTLITVMVIIYRKFRFLSRNLRKLSLLIFGLLVLSPSFSQPILPHFFYGNVKIISVGEEGEVEDGTIIYALIENEVKGTAVVNHSLEWDFYMVVDGGKNGDLIRFKVGDKWADQTYTFTSGGYTNLNLTVTLEEKAQESPYTPSKATSGGTFPTHTSCEENWTCSEWSPCYPNGTQYRSCVDLNECGTTKNKPAETRTCTYSPPPPYCGDYVCQENESCETCEIDCGICAECGNGICEAEENSSNCCIDCGCPRGKICDEAENLCIEENKTVAEEGTSLLSSPTLTGYFLLTNPRTLTGLALVVGSILTYLYLRRRL